MEINVLKNSKEEIEIEVDNLTIVELLRVYLNKDSSVSFAAWRREHPTKKPVLKVQTKGKTAKKRSASQSDSILCFRMTSRKINTSR